MIQADPGAAQALRGSILSAGLPDGPQKTGPQKQDSMKFQSWSSVSLREPWRAVLGFALNRDGFPFLRRRFRFRGLASAAGHSVVHDVPFRFKKL